MKFHEKLCQLRLEKNLSQEKLAEVLSVSRQTIAKWESDKASPTIDKLVALSVYFGVTTDALIKSVDCEYSAPQNNSSIVTDDALAFLISAKQSAYAAKAPETAPSRPASHDWFIEKGPFIYIDSYVGSEKFAGEEVLYENRVAIWSMNYVGRVIHPAFCGDFLKEVLFNATPQYPYRGPLLYKKGEYTYHNSVSGCFEWFSGFEEIYYNDQKTYECQYHGGILV